MNNQITQLKSELLTLQDETLRLSVRQREIEIALLQLQDLEPFDVASYFAENFDIGLDSPTALDNILSEDPDFIDDNISWDSLNQSKDTLKKIAIVFNALVDNIEYQERTLSKKELESMGFEEVSAGVFQKGTGTIDLH